jgi:hypothetical protein
MQHAQQESHNADFEAGSEVLDILGVPGLFDGLCSVLEERGLLNGRAPSLKRLRDALDGRYRIIGELGRGGNAVVYLAYDNGLQRPVALKVLLASRHGPEVDRDRLLREARTAANLSHPNIVSIHTVEEAGDFVFFTMDYVEGETLWDIVSERGPLPVGEATRIMHDAAWAVGRAHAKGVIHRDLTPDNIMIEAGPERRVLVMDFGIAQVEAQPGIDRSGYVLGTAPFVSPEQVTGGAGDERSDVYALGITGYFAVTGELPFFADTTEEIFLQHLTEEPPPLRAFGENLDLTYSRAVNRCLAKDPGSRFASGRQLAELLATSPELRGGDLAVPLAAFVQRVNRLSERSRGVSVLVAVGLFGLVRGFFSVNWSLSAWSAGLLGFIGTVASILLLPKARRLFRAGYDRDDLVHALKVDLKREQRIMAYNHGKRAGHTRPDMIHAGSADPQRQPDSEVLDDKKLIPLPARIARNVAYGGLLILLLATALSFVPGIDLVVGFSIMLVGTVITVVGGIVSHLYNRARRDIPRSLWLAFWGSRVGGWAARVAAIGLGRGRGEEGEGALTGEDG